MTYTGACLLLDCLRLSGVDTIFGYPGGAALPIYDALARVIVPRHILVRHEQGAAHAADAYARASGRLGVCLATSGPGATNLLTGLACAAADSVPLLAITGQVASPLFGTDAFQEVDTLGLSLPVTRFSALVRSAAEIPALLARAITEATHGRPGPVLLDLPKDVAAGPADPALAQAFHPPARKATTPTTAAIEEAARMLRQARRPVVLAGGGVVRAGASAELLALVQRLQAPVTTTLMALGAVPSGHQLFVGLPGMHGTRRANTALHEADVVLAVGARFDDRVTGRADRFSPSSRRIHLDVDASEHGKIVHADVCLHGDAKASLAMLCAALEGNTPQTAPWLQRLHELPRRAPMVGAGNGLDPRVVFEAINELAPPGTLFVTDVGQHQMWAAQHLRLEHPGQFITSGGLGAMGFGVPGALGARLGAPHRPVVAIVGDGGFQMTCQELTTMARYGVQVVVLVLDNQCLGMVRQWQQLFHGRRYSEVDLSDNPDFAALSRALGAAGETADTAPRLREALVRALQRDGPTVLHVPVHREGNVFPIVPPGQPANVMLDSEEKP